MAIRNSKKTSIITVTITNSNSNYNCFYFPSNNSIRNCITAYKPQLLQTITFIKRLKNLLCITKCYNTLKNLRCRERDPFHMN